MRPCCRTSTPTRARWRSARARRSTCCGRPSAARRSPSAAARGTPRRSTRAAARRWSPSATARPDLSAVGADRWTPLIELLEAPVERETVYVNLTPHLVYSLYQAVAAAVAPRVVILAHNRTEGLRTAAEQALLRQIAAPRYEVVQLARSWQGTPFTLVELRGGGPRDEREVYRDATSTSMARVASGAPQSSSDAGVATRVAGAGGGDRAAQRPLGERVGEALLGCGAVAGVLRDAAAAGRQRGGEPVAQLGGDERGVDHVAELVGDGRIAVQLALAVEVGEVEAHLVGAGEASRIRPTARAAGVAVGREHGHPVDVVDQLARLGARLVDRGQDPLAVLGRDAVGEAERRGASRPGRSPSSPPQPASTTRQNTSASSRRSICRWIGRRVRDLKPGYAGRHEQHLRGQARGADSGQRGQRAGSPRSASRDAAPSVPRTPATCWTRST